MPDILQTMLFEARNLPYWLLESAVVHRLYNRYKSCPAILKQKWAERKEAHVAYWQRIEQEYGLEYQDLMSLTWCYSNGKLEAELAYHTINREPCRITWAKMFNEAEAYAMLKQTCEAHSIANSAKYEPFEWAKTGKVKFIGRPLPAYCSRELNSIDNL